MELAWTDELSVGNALIDSEHKNLIVAVNSVEHAIASKDRIALSKAFELLDTYIKIHFRNEEIIAAAANIPFANNRLEHQYLLKKLCNMREEMENNKGISADELIQKYSGYLSRWMTDHIINEDMQMKPVLKTYPYNFSAD